VSYSVIFLSLAAVAVISSTLSLTYSHPKKIRKLPKYSPFYAYDENGNETDEKLDDITNVPTISVVK